MIRCMIRCLCSILETVTSDPTDTYHYQNHSTQLTLTHSGALPLVSAELEPKRYSSRTGDSHGINRLLVEPFPRDRRTTGIENESIRRVGLKLSSGTELDIVCGTGYPYAPITWVIVNYWRLRGSSGQCNGAHSCTASWTRLYRIGDMNRNTLDSEWFLIDNLYHGRRWTLF